MSTVEMAFSVDFSYNHWIPIRFGYTEVVDLRK